MGTPLVPSVPLGAYTLPGRVSDPTVAVGQAQMAEHLGLDTRISERYGTKDLGVLGGAIPQATADIKIASGVAHFLFRHPLVLAGMALTLQALSGERFMLGVGRSVDRCGRGRAAEDDQPGACRLCGHPSPAVPGEKVKYGGPAGRFPSLRLGDVPDVAPPPTLLAAIGPKTLELAGRHFDGAILHPFLTTDAVRASADKVRAGAEAAGRDPDAARIYATVVTAPDLTDEQELAVVGGRAVTYYQIPEFGELLARQWLGSGRARHSAVAPDAGKPPGSADNAFTKDDLAEVSRSLPQEWLHEGAAIGSAGACADRLHEYLAAGADEIIVHGAVPDLLGPTLQHFRAR